MAKKTTKKSGSSKKVENEKTVAILSYLLIGIVWYFAEEKLSKSSLAKFHVKQAINLWLLLVAIQVVANLMFFFGFIVAIAGNLFFLVMLIFGLINAADRKKRYLPIIGRLAERYLDF